MFSDNACVLGTSHTTQALLCDFFILLQPLAKHSTFSIAGVHRADTLTEPLIDLCSLILKNIPGLPSAKWHESNWLTGEYEMLKFSYFSFPVCKNPSALFWVMVPH